MTTSTRSSNRSKTTPSHTTTTLPLNPESYNSRLNPGSTPSADYQKAWLEANLRAVRPEYNQFPELLTEIEALVKNFKFSRQLKASGKTRLLYLADQMWYVHFTRRIKAGRPPPAYLAETVRIFSPGRVFTDHFALLLDTCGWDAERVTDPTLTDDQRRKSTKTVSLSIHAKKRRKIPGSSANGFAKKKTSPVRNGTQLAPLSSRINDSTISRGKMEGIIVKRESDGQIVKLVCPDCFRWKLGSLSGFLNHCRFVHKKPYTLGEAAVICGQPVDDSEGALPVGSHSRTDKSQHANLKATNKGQGKPVNKSKSLHSMMCRKEGAKSVRKSKRLSAKLEPSQRASEDCHEDEDGAENETVLRINEGETVNSSQDRVIGKGKGWVIVAGNLSVQGKVVKKGQGYVMVAGNSFTDNSLANKSLDDNSFVEISLTDDLLADYVPTYQKSLEESTITSRNLLGLRTDTSGRPVVPHRGARVAFDTAPDLTSRKRQWEDSGSDFEDDSMDGSDSEDDNTGSTNRKRLCQGDLEEGFENEIENDLGDNLSSSSEEVSDFGDNFSPRPEEVVPESADNLLGSCQVVNALDSDLGPSEEHDTETAADTTPTTHIQVGNDTAPPQTDFDQNPGTRTENQPSVSNPSSAVDPDDHIQSLIKRGVNLKIVRRLTEVSIADLDREIANCEQNHGNGVEDVRKDVLADVRNVVLANLENLEKELKTVGKEIREACCAYDSE